MIFFEPEGNYLKAMRVEVVMASLLQKKRLVRPSGIKPTHTEVGWYASIKLQGNVPTRCPVSSSTWTVARHCFDIRDEHLDGHGSCGADDEPNGLDLSS